MANRRISVYIPQTNPLTCPIDKFLLCGKRKIVWLRLIFRLPQKKSRLFLSLLIIVKQKPSSFT